MYHIFFIHASVDRHLGCFHILAVANDAAVNIGLRVSFTSHQSEWPSTKSLRIINARQSVERRGPSYTAGGNVNWCSHYGEQYEGSLKNKK